MPARPERDEQIFIRLFVSAYEKFAWAGSTITPLDELTDGAVEALVMRADGQTMAIEHTLIEPFVGDKRDFAMFAQAFLRIEDDKSLAVPGTGIRVFVPVGVLDGRKRRSRDLIVDAIHRWIAANRLLLLEGEHEYQCELSGMPPITLAIKRRNLGSSHPGSFQIRRQQVTNDLDKVIDKALRRKLPKLANTKADRHVLFLERDQFSFFPKLIFREIERQRPTFSLLEKIDEIWHVETIGYKQDGYVYFELWRGGEVSGTSFISHNGGIVDHYEDGRPIYPEIITA